MTDTAPKPWDKQKTCENHKKPYVKFINLPILWICLATYSNFMGVIADLLSYKFKFSELKVHLLNYRFKFHGLIVDLLSYTFKFCECTVDLLSYMLKYREFIADLLSYIFKFSEFIDEKTCHLTISSAQNGTWHVRCSINALWLKMSP